MTAPNYIQLVVAESKEEMNEVGDAMQRNGNGMQRNAIEGTNK